MYFVVKEGSSVYIYSVFWEELNFCKCFDIESMKILSVFIFLFWYEIYIWFSKIFVKIYVFEFFLV